MRFPLKTVLVTTLLMTRPTVVAGQTLGFRGGWSVPTLGGDDAGENNTRTALSFGGFFNVPVSNVLGVQLGVGVAQKGATREGDRVELAMDYLEIPLLLMFSPPTTGNMGFNFFIGPALGFRTSCTRTSPAGVTVSVDDCDDVDISLKSVDWGAMVGAGLDIGLTGNVSLVFDGFYNLGLTKIDDGGSVDRKNRALSILAGLSFSVGR